MEITVGIDVSKKRLDVYVHPAGTLFSLDNEEAGLLDLVEQLGALRPDCIGLEATGGYERLAAATLAEAGLPVVVINPAQVRHYAKAVGKRAKTDSLDARMIALFIAATEPEPRALVDEQTAVLAELMARRRQLVGMLVAEKNRLGRLPPGKARLSVVRIIAALNDELAKLDSDLGGLIERSPVWRDKQDLLASVPGIGDTIARALLADLPELGQLDRRAIAALAGLAPFTRQSGQWRGKSFIAGGRAAPRSALFIGAMVAARHNAPLKLFYQRLIAAGKPKRVALIATARKLLTILNAIIRDQKPWQNA
ncbi:MAG: IS110 family transposase [Devosia sp.]